MNNLTQKLIRDGSDKSRIRMNIISISIGFGLLFIGVVCIVAKALTDSGAAVERNFFLLPIGAAFIFGGLIAFAVTGIRNTILLLRCQNRQEKTACFRVTMLCTAILLCHAGVVLFLLAANAGTKTLPACAACLTASLAAGVTCIFWKKGEKTYEMEA